MGSTSRYKFIESSGLTNANAARTQMVPCFFVLRMEKTEYRLPGTKTSSFVFRAKTGASCRPKQSSCPRESRRSARAAGEEASAHADERGRSNSQGAR